MDANQRIAQFETMVRPGADPDNDMAWFSLGKAYSDAGRHAEAASAFNRCVELNPAMSKAYQLGGEAFVASGNLASAAELLRKGYVAAHSRGDRMPMTAMGELLKKIGEDVPQVSAEAAAVAGPAGSFVCKRTGRAGVQLEKPPFKGALGVWIHANIARETWESWVKQGTKVINELRLDLSREEDGETYDRHMREFLGVDDELYASLTGAKP